MNVTDWATRYRAWAASFTGLWRTGEANEAEGLLSAANELLTGNPVPVEALDAYRLPGDRHIGGDASFDVVVDASLNIVLVNTRGRCTVSDVGAMIVALGVAYNVRNYIEADIDRAAGRPVTQYPPLPNLERL